MSCQQDTPTPPPGEHPDWVLDGDDVIDVSDEHERMVQLAFVLDTITRGRR